MNCTKDCHEHCRECSGPVNNYCSFPTCHVNVANCKDPKHKEEK